MPQIFDPAVWILCHSSACRYFLHALFDLGQLAISKKARRFQDLIEMGLLL